MASAIGKRYPEVGAGGFSRLDGTLQFYFRVNSLLRPDMTVLDLGAGRGCQLSEGASLKDNLIKIQGKVAKLIGVDVDPIVMTNSFVDESHVYDGKVLPVESRSVDLVYSDWVLEHVEDPAYFASEVDRVLKSGGWFCARTPHSFSYVALASRMIPNDLHAKVLRKVQKKTHREDADVFPTFYRMNTLGAIERLFPHAEYENFSYTWTPEPAYHFGKAAMVRFWDIAQYIKKPFGGENVMVFVRKR